MKTMPVPLCVAVWLLMLLLAPGRAAAMNLARVETRVDDAVARFGVTGKGVLVAVMDRGIDWANNDFRNADGSTRIVAIFDLTDDSGANDPNNPYGIGTLYSADDINAALTGGPTLATRDAEGHGTTTAGIACGNGANSLNAEYRGVATNAALLIIKIVSDGVPAHGDQPAEAAFYDPTRIPTAIQFATDTAQSLGMPCVMTLNIGSQEGPTDGSSALCQAIDQAVGPGKPGLVFLTGAGDDGGMPNRAGGVVAQGQTVPLQVQMGDAGSLVVNLWYAGTDRLDVTIQSPDGNSATYASPASNNDYDFEATGDFTYYHYGAVVNSYGSTNGERQIYLELTGPTGLYTLSLTGAQVTNGHFQATLNPSQIWNTAASSNLFLNDLEPGSIWDGATAFYNICAGDYVIRTNWVDIDGNVQSQSGEGLIGGLWPGSSVGPTFDGRPGIDVCLPGDSVFTTYATNSYWETFRFNLIQNGGGFYGRASAVSAADPMLAGMSALLLEMNPNLDAAGVKSILQRSARADADTGAVPNPMWGYGKADAYNALILAAPAPQIGSVMVNGNQLALTFSTVKGMFYEVDRAGSLGAPGWTSIANKIAGTGGSLQQTDALTAGPGQAFYRVVMTP